MTNVVTYLAGYDNEGFALSRPLGLVLLRPTSIGHVHVTALMQDW